MVADVKEKLDIWRYSRACSKVLIIFFLYNLLSILYHATILCCVLFSYCHARHNGCHVLGLRNFFSFFALDYVFFELGCHLFTAL